MTSAYKTHARRLREALAADGIPISQGKALELVARQNGARDWNTLAARAVPAVRDETPVAKAGPVPPFSVGDAVAGSFNARPAQGRVIGLEETLRPGLWRATVAFDPPVDASTLPLLRAERRRVTMVVGADGRSRRLTGTETGVMALARAG